ncbi:hypothetical protein IW140_001457 [Coemansia sp. RSA 1813]|nr:hypothetical protein EV178_003302 [Coemansia sp. RSA 1646]KAJ1771531.1 hypothetical protein LPJ74_002219 [Coemansia sp. RSA 1843]KAJ2089610.1 hypothetical protein IW138_003352 [Coemansia sp. RSA 986]KAJ2571539.1 hypothetical protein IW140_001457 [Coemansia sp. RSA 1813]
MYGGEYGTDAFDEGEDERLYQQQGGNTDEDSDNIDSDVEEKILSHLYYQSNEQATSSAPTPTQVSRISTPVVARRSVPKKKSLESKKTKQGTPVSDKEDQESKYAIGSKRRKQENSWKLSDLAAPTDSEQKADSEHSSDEEGELSNPPNGHALSVTMVPAYRTATNSDDGVASEDEPSHENGTQRAAASRNVSASHTVSYNASDDDAVNDYLDNVASSGLVTPPNTIGMASANGLAGVAEHDMEHQLVQVDTLLSPTTQANTAGAVLHEVPAKRAFDPEDNEYDYLDEAEIQGHNRYFMEEKEIICRRCHKAGHIAKDCTTVTCMVCGKEGHMSKDCKLTGNVCHRCNMRGHIAVDCPQQQSGDRRDRNKVSGCERCKLRTHHTDECPTIWRRYVYAGHRPLKYNDVKPWCYNCGCSGHFGDDCTIPRGRGANAFLGNTAFSFDNCPGHCIGDSNLHSGRNSYRGAGGSGGYSSSRPPRRGGKFASSREERRRDDGHGRRDWRNHRGSDGPKRKSPSGSSKKKSKPNGAGSASSVGNSR